MKPDTADAHVIQFIDELVDLAVGGFDLALKTGLAQVKIRPLVPGQTSIFTRGF